MKQKVIFCVELDEEYERIYKELKTSNPDWMIQQKLVELGFVALIDLRKRKLI